MYSIISQVKNAKTFCKLDELKDIKSTENADPKTCSQAAAILENVRDCEPSTLTEFTLDLSTLDETARKQCLSLVVPAYEQYVETQASKNPRRIFTIIAESSESVLKRSRRAAENVMLNYPMFDIVSDFSNFVNLFFSYFRIQNH